MTETGGSDGDKLVARRRGPKRRDSRQTSEAILDSTARLLEVVGFEDLSTNMICKHAGLTPPALYHYFPNKYAILFELAHNLLTRQYTALDHWIEAGGLAWTETSAGSAAFQELQGRLRAVADAQIGALWIMRGMRAIPKLREVRIVAHEFMVERLLDALCVRYPGSTRHGLSVPSFLLGEIIHMGAELELDHPTLEIERLRSSLAANLVAFIRTLEQ